MQLSYQLEHKFLKKYKAGYIDSTHIICYKFVIEKVIRFASLYVLIHPYAFTLYARPVAGAISSREYSF
ncbi:MAG: hypothetical protein D3918_04205 [Candidatus Electrothrix sp. AX2]|nr:hypothetical protein [Candidatus Electrothrix gigas]